MALNPSSSMVGKIEPPSPEYPYGEARNVTAPSDGTGTPFIDILINDIFGLQQALLQEAGITPSGSPDTATNSQYLSAFNKLLRDNSELLVPTFSALGTGTTISGYILKTSDIVALYNNGGLLKTAVNNTTSNAGGASYKILTLAEKDASEYVGTEGYACVEINGSGYWACLVVDSSINIVNTGAINGGAVDNSPNINMFIQLTGRLVAPVGDFEIRNPIIVPSGTVGRVWEGKGMESTNFICVGMNGMNGIEKENPSDFMRVQMRDFQVKGDCDHAFNFDGTGAQQMCEFRNLRSTSRFDSFRMNEHFSCSWYNVHTETTVDGHGIVLEGGNSTVLTNCYAHNIAGVGKAGYRIGGAATLTDCNGVDSGEIWGIFGGQVDGVGVNNIYRINIIGGNIEDFEDTGIVTLFTGSLIMQNVAMIAPAVGTSPTFDSYIRMECSNSIFKRIAGSWQSKGSVRSMPQDVTSGSNQRSIYIEDQTTDQPKFYRTDLASSYDAATMYQSAAAFGISATKDTYVDYERSYGFNCQVPISWVDVSTLDVTGKTLVKTGNTVATNMNTASGGVEGQELTILINDPNTTIKHNGGGAGRFVNNSGADIVGAVGDVYTYYSLAGVWYQSK